MQTGCLVLLHLGCGEAKQAGVDTFLVSLVYGTDFGSTGTSKKNGQVS